MGTSNLNWKLEEELALHLRKALSSDGLAPKQKHVRWCSVYTWDTTNASSFWNALKSYPVNGQDQVALKALILLHRVIREGHPSVLEEANSHLEWLKSLSNVSLYNNKGYVVIIKGYTNFLISKLQCHSIHPEFDSTFSYKEYIALKRVEDPNEGFETITDLISLLEKIDSLQKLIFTSFRQGSSNEINISALAPLVEESYAIHQFLVSFLTAMHKTVADPIQALQPLRTKFNAVHTAMHYFYKNSKTIRYLVSIVTVPDLPKIAPEFVDPVSEDDQKISKPATTESLPQQKNPNTPAQIQQRSELSDLIEYEKRLRDEISLELEKQHDQSTEMSVVSQQIQYKSIQELVSQSNLPAPPTLMQHNQYGIQQRVQPDYQSLVAYIRSLLLHIRMLKERLDVIHNDLYSSRLQSAELQAKLDQISAFVCERDQKITSLGETIIKKENEKFEISRAAQESSRFSESKYNTLASLYTRLRMEHVAALEKYKELKELNDKLSQINLYEVDNLRRGLAARDDMITSLKNSELLAREQLSKATAIMQAKTSQEVNAADNINRLLKNLEDLNLSYSTSEQRHINEEKTLSKRLELAQEELIKKENEIVSFFAREKQLTSATLKQSTEYQKKCIDDVIETVSDQICSFIDKLGYSISNPEFNARHVSPNNVLFCIEILLDTIHNFSESLKTLFSNGLSPQYQAHSQFIKIALSIPKTLEDIIINTKSFDESYCSGNDDTITDCLNLLTSSLKSLVFASAPSRYDSSVFGSLDQALSGVIDNLKEIVVNSGTHKPSKESRDINEEFQNFEEEIEKSSNWMKDIIDSSNKITLPDSLDPSIFERVMHVLSAAATLAKRASEAQKDIEQNEKNSGEVSNQSLYNITSVWRSGLISAAHSISSACFTVVEYADGLIKGTKTREQLIVAAHEISTSATHLITSVRVRSYPGQESHALLELACSSLRQAVLILVREVMNAPKKSEEKNNPESVFDDSNAAIQENPEPLSDQKLKLMEMEQKVKIIELEKKLSDHRHELGEILRMSYTKASQ